MDEAEWLGCDDPRLMMSFLYGRVGEPPQLELNFRHERGGDRKQLLLLCALFRPSGDKEGMFVPSYADAGERLADGLASADERWSPAPLWDVWERAFGSSARNVKGPGPARLVALVREVFGNPFRPVALDPAWLTPTVVSLARAAYDHRDLPAGTLDPARLAVLADALEEAGCTDADILGHLRQPGTVHVRGCWVLDWLLGKGREA